MMNQNDCVRMGDMCRSKGTLAEAVVSSIIIPQSYLISSVSNEPPLNSRLIKTLAKYIQVVHTTKAKDVILRTH